MDLKKPPATLEQIEEEELNNLKNCFKKLYDLWRKFGMTEEQKIKRANITWMHIFYLMEDIFNEEKSFYEEIKNRIQENAKHVLELSEILDVTTKLDNTMSLVKQEEYLREEFSYLTHLKHARLKSLQNLRSVESKLCSLLMIEEHKISTPNGVPSEKDLKEIEQRISLLRKERERRFKKLCDLRMDLSTILEITELCPETLLDKDILSGSDDVSLSNEILEAAEESVSKAQKKKTDMENQRKDLLLKLSALWDLLRIPDSKKKEFLSRHQDCKLTTLKSLRHELEQCEMIKKENIKMYVEKLREKLKTLWDNCFVSECERDHFCIYYTRDMTIEVLEAHESEVEKWENYYEKIRSIATKIDKRRELWDLLLVHENEAVDPNKFKNRKDNLLKEKERKKLQKDLPALESEIFCEIDLHDSTYSKPFLYFGQDYRSFVTNQWQERKGHKENERITRRNQRLLDIETKINMRNSATRKFTTPKSVPSKLFKSCRDGSVCHTPTADKSLGNPYSIGKSVLAINKLMSSAQKSSVSYKLFSSVSPRPKVIMKRGQERNKSRNTTDEPNSTPRRSPLLASKKVGGIRISINSSKIPRKIIPKLHPALKTTPTVCITNNTINESNLTPRYISEHSSKKRTGTRMPINSTKKPRKSLSKTVSKSASASKAVSKSTPSASKAVSKSTLSLSKAILKPTPIASKAVSKSIPSLTTMRGQPGQPFLN